MRIHTNVEVPPKVVDNVCWVLVHAPAPAQRQLLQPPPESIQARRSPPARLLILLCGHLALLECQCSAPGA